MSDNSTNVDAPSHTYKVMTWNIEGLKRNVFCLSELTKTYAPDMIFLSEPQIFQCDTQQHTACFKGEYLFFSNSEDQFDHDLPLIRPRAFGGTMAMWSIELDPYVTIHPPPSASILPLLFDPPGQPASIHITVYLPTHGHDNEFVTELSNLSVLISQLEVMRQDSDLYVQGDFNVNDKNTARRTLFDSFKSSHSLLEVEIDHTTYHHFTGNGSSDSLLDRLLYKSCRHITEQLNEVVCKLDYPLITSCHDVLLSSWQNPVLEQKIQPDHMKKAPRITNNRFKTVWTDEGVVAYQQLIVPHLNRLQELWLSTPSKTALSLLMNATNDVLTECAKATNKVCPLLSLKLDAFHPKSRDLHNFS